MLEVGNAIQWAIEPNCFDTNINSYLKTSGGQSYKQYLKVVHLTPVLIRHLWQLKTVVSNTPCFITIIIFVGVRYHQNDEGF